MGLRDKFRKLRHSSPVKGIELRKRNISSSSLPVSEQTLQAWRALPPQIRQDPSMASFRMENERLHGSSISTNAECNLSHAMESYEDFEHRERASQADSQFITIKNTSTHTNHIDLDERSKQDDGLLYKQPLHELKNGEIKIERLKRRRVKFVKRVCLLLFWIFAVVVFMIVEEKHLLEKTLEVPHERDKYFMLQQKPTGDFKLNIFGTFNETVHDDVLPVWIVPLVNEELLDYAPVLVKNKTYKMTDDLLENLSKEESKFRLKISTNINEDLTIKLIYNPLIINIRTGALLAALILMTFYALLIWEATIVCSMLSIAILACFNDRPNMGEIVEWMDMEMLTLLFCMMIIVAVLTETGVFDYIAVVAFEISGGKTWPMIYSLCLITCFLSSFLDNMTTVLLMTPAVIRLCEVLNLDPVPVLMGVIVHSNIGGSLTPIGDPISIIIYSNHFMTLNDITFMKFVAHTLPGVALTVIQSCIYLRLIFYDINSLRLNESKDIKELRREIRVWHKAANSISSFSKDADSVRETMQNKVRILKDTLKRKLRDSDITETYVHTLEDLKLKYPIKNKTLLIQASAALVFVIVCFFIQSVPRLRTLPMGWVALLGIIALLIVLDRDDMDQLMHRIEWTTLLFFAAMFVMMECVERLGLFNWISQLTEYIILCVDKRNRLAMSIFIILWMSALASAVLDSIPVTVMMVKLVISLVTKTSLNLPLEPLVWALAFGPALGGNGTLYGASANVISAGIAEQHGYKISFTRYLRIVFPMMLTQITYAEIKAYRETIIT
uniref:Citrate transporter-like domain-containing protein n=1 Tax=Glossina brevipalpis TaxID=37001 RepID=A0A1A9WKN0_9MUSC